MSIAIEQGPWRRISSAECHGEDIVIEGIGAGLGILVYDPTSRATFGGHFPSPDAQHAGGLIALLQQSAEDFRHSALVRIHVTGCSEQDYEEWGRKGPDTHRFVEAQLRKCHCPNQRKDVRWPRSTVRFAEMSLYPHSGEYQCGFRW